MMSQAKTSTGWFAILKATLQECRVTFKEGGFKAVVRRYGWKLFAVFFVYYLIRDAIIYLLIPYLIAKHFI
jgi:hypothetical protein